MKFENMQQIDNLVFDEAEYRNVTVNKKQADNYKAIYNLTQDKLIKIKKVGDKILINHKELVKSFYDLSRSENLNFKGWLKNSGNNIKLHAYLPDGKDYRDGVKQGLIIKNEYGKNTTVGVFGFRVKCENGLIMDGAEKMQIKITNTNELKGALKTCINTLLNSHNKINEMIKKAEDDRIGREMAVELLNILVGSKKHKEKIINILNENVQTEEVSRWELYNAIAQHATHGGVKDSRESSLQRQAQKILLETKFNRLVKR